MDYAIFTQIGPPWLYVVGSSVEQASELRWTVRRETANPPLVRVLRGRRMHTEQELFDELAAVMQFPWYFGDNWNAVDDCLDDLAWMPADAYLLIITEADQVLSGNSDSFAILIDVLVTAAQGWSVDVPQSRRPMPKARAFHVLLQCDAGGLDELRRRIKATVAGSAVEIGVLDLPEDLRS